MDRGKLFDLVALLVIAAIGLFTAYVTFGILKSQAEAKIQEYSVQGAIAGALISWSLLASLYLQFRKSSGEVEDLRRRNEELQQKVIRGAPCPPGFETEVDERQRIVLARPQQWSPRGGVIFDFEMPDELLRPDDFLPARFTASFIPITPAVPPMDEYYDKAMEEPASIPIVFSHSAEFIFIGGEPHPIRTLKIIAEQFARVQISKDPWTGKDRREWVPLTREQQEMMRAPQPPSPPETAAPPKPVSPSPPPPPPPVRVAGVKVLRMKIICYHAELKKIFFFDFVDDATDFARSSADFNRLLASARFLN